MADAKECAICLQDPENPYEIPNCKHYFCRKCIETILPDEKGNLLCPLCRGVFLVNDLVPHSISRKRSSTASPVSQEVTTEDSDEDSGIAYCLKLDCPPNSGCKKLHVNDICKTPLARDKERAKPNVAADNTAESRPKFALPKGATYCQDITCPGGSSSKCGNKHECDILKATKAA